MLSLLACRGPPPPPPAVIVDAGSAAAPLEELAVRVVRFEGAVEVKRQGRDTWEPLQPGTTLDVHDAIRTAPGASAELDAGGHRVQLLESTDVKVDELTSGLTRYLLGSGLLSGEARGGDGKLEIGVAGTDVAVRAADGKFQMSSNGSGTVAVAAQDGDVSVAAKGKEVVLHKGQRTLVLPEQPPREPAPLATSLLLKVQWPKERETNKRYVTIAGRTEAGALVFAMGRPVRLDAGGRFSERVALPDGETQLKVTAVDVSGNAAREAGPRVLVDTKGAASRFRTDDLWKTNPQPR